MMVVVPADRELDALFQVWECGLILRLCVRVCVLCATTCWCGPGVHNANARVWGRGRGQAAPLVAFVAGAPPGHMDAVQKTMVDAAQAAAQLASVIRQLSPAATDIAASIAQA